MKTKEEKQRKYYICRIGDLAYTGQTVMCAPSKVDRMSAAMGVKFMRHCRQAKYQPQMPVA